MPARSSEHASIERALGGLLQAVETLTKAFDKSEVSSAMHRKESRDALERIDAKVDPIINDLKALKLTVAAHEVILRTYEDRRKERAVIERLARWLVHIAWMIAGTVALLWGDYIKIPLSKILSFWNKAAPHY